MIHYHGGPVTPTKAAVEIWTARHACCSFAEPTQTPIAFEVCQSVMLDNGAFTAWKDGGKTIDVAAYLAWVREYERHPAFDFAIIPDVIDGSEADNEEMIRQWDAGRGRHKGVPVWHLHESLERLRSLSGEYDRVALGSSGDYAKTETESWWHRIGEAMDIVCDDQGRPTCKLHGLRMLSPTIFSHVPLASADSTNIALNIKIDQAWKGPYKPVTPGVRAIVMAERIEHHVAAVRWNRATHGTQHNLELIG